MLFHRVPASPRLIHAPFPFRLTPTTFTPQERRVHGFPSLGMSGEAAALAIMAAYHQGRLTEAHLEAAIRDPDERLVLAVLEELPRDAWAPYRALIGARIDEEAERYLWTPLLDAYARVGLVLLSDLGPILREWARRQVPVTLHRLIGFRAPQLAVEVCDGSRRLTPELGRWLARTSAGVVGFLERDAERPLPPELVSLFVDRGLRSIATRVAAEPRIGDNAGTVIVEGEHARGIAILRALLPTSVAACPPGTVEALVRHLEDPTSTIADEAADVLARLEGLPQDVVDRALRAARGRPDAMALFRALFRRPDVSLDVIREVLLAPMETASRAHDSAAGCAVGQGEAKDATERLLASIADAERRATGTVGGRDSGRLRATVERRALVDAVLASGRTDVFDDPALRSVIFTMAPSARAAMLLDYAAPHEATPLLQALLTRDPWRVGRYIAEHPVMYVFTPREMLRVLAIKDLRVRQAALALLDTPGLLQDDWVVPPPAVTCADAAPPAHDAGPTVKRRHLALVS